MSKPAAAIAVKKTETKFDAYNTAERIRVARARVEAGEYRDDSGDVAWSIPSGVSKAILEYVDSRAADRDCPLSQGRVLLYYLDLPRVAAKLGIEFLEPCKGTVEKFSDAYRDLAGNSRKTYADLLVSFWRWRFEQQEKDLPSHLRIHISKKALATKTEDDVLTEDEQARIATATISERDEAFVKVLWESGARVSELLGANVGDVSRNEHGGFLLRVEGKTGRRAIPLFGVGVPALSKWLGKHPLKNEPAAPLFCGTRVGPRLGKRMTYGGVMSILLTAARRAGVERAANPHIWRHTRATAVAKDARISPTIMNGYFGWTNAGRTSAAYIHQSARDVENAFAESLGVAKVEQRAPSSVLPKSCPRCEFVNDPTDRFCGRCAAPLSPESVGRFLELESKANRLASLLKRPEIIAYLAEQLAAGPTD